MKAVRQHLDDSRNVMVQGILLVSAFCPEGVPRGSVGWVEGRLFYIREGDTAVDINHG